VNNGCFQQRIYLDTQWSYF